MKVSSIQIEKSSIFSKKTLAISIIALITIGAAFKASSYIKAKPAFSDLKARLMVHSSADPIEPFNLEMGEEEVNSYIEKFDKAGLFNYEKASTPKGFANVIFRYIYNGGKDPNGLIAHTLKDIIIQGWHESTTWKETTHGLMIQQTFVNLWKAIYILHNIDFTNPKIPESIKHHLHVARVFVFGGMNHFAKIFDYFEKNHAYFNHSSEELVQVHGKQEYYTAIAYLGNGFSEWNSGLAMFFEELVKLDQHLNGTDKEEYLDA